MIEWNKIMTGTLTLCCAAFIVWLSYTTFINSNKLVSIDTKLDNFVTKVENAESFEELKIWITENFK